MPIRWFDTLEKSLSIKQKELTFELGLWWCQISFPSIICLPRHTRFFLQPVDRRSSFQDTFKWCRWRNTEEERFGGAAEAFSASATKAPLLFGAAFFLSCDSAKGYGVVVNAEAELRKRQKLLFSSQLRRHLKKVASSREPGEEPPKVGVPTFGFSGCIQNVNQQVATVNPTNSF